jgi:Icc-related predicted phosphoesterase
LKLLVLSDLHGGHTAELTEEPDVILLLGDIDYWEVRKIDQAYTCPKLAVHGNHDGFDHYINTGIEDIHGKTVTILGKTFAGFGGCPRYNSRPFGQFDEEEADDFLHPLPRVDVFIAHSNPRPLKGSFDETEAHRGFQAFTDYILRKQPAYFFHGHLHDEDVREITNTTIYSVYPSLLVSI